MRERLAGPALGGGEHRGIWPDNAAIVAAFLAVATQWRLAPVGGGLAPGRLIAVGLDYAGVRAGLAAAGIALSPAQWRGLQVMEDEALRALNASG